MVSEGTDIHVVLAADERYALPLAAAVRSLVSSTKEPGRLTVYVLDGGLSRSTRDGLRSSWPSQAEVRFVAACSDRIARMPLPGNRRWLPQLSRSMFLRLIVPDLLPQIHGKALYLDSDVLVLSDVTELCDVDLDGHPVAAVEDPGVGVVSAPLGLLNYEELSLDPDEKYFNSGVLLLDLDAWRAEGLGERVLRYARDHQDAIRFPDQDSLNAVLAGRWKPLDASWNVAANEAFRLARLPSRRVETSDAPPPGARLLHFTGPVKPWMTEFKHLGYRDLFRSYVPPTFRLEDQEG